MIEQASAGYGSGESAIEILSKIKLNLVPVRALVYSVKMVQENQP